jgi:RNA polymerase sigma-70 factor (ECF subfamily)
MSLLERVMAKLRSEFAAAGKSDQFDKLSVFLNRESESARYDVTGRQMGLSAVAFRVAVHRMRRRCRKLLREEIAETVSTPEQADDEIRFLLTILSG